MQDVLMTQLLAKTSFLQRFAGSTSAIQNYCVWIASQSIPDDSALNNVLTVCKTDAAQWYNTIYPTYLDMPATIARSGSTITGLLTLLIQLASQLQAGSSPALLQQIAQNAATLQADANNLENQLSALAGQLRTFQANLSQNARVSIVPTLHSVQQQIAQGNQDLNQLYGQLHSLQHATCPKKSQIAACEYEIQQQEQLLKRLFVGMGVFQQAAQLNGAASTGAAYLTSYWQGIATDAASCQATLANLQQQPPLIMKLSLQSALQNWKALLQQYSGLPPAARAGRQPA
ncbi:MAG: hypothetical protein JWP58_676 [Hymenobacter sp.]|nr:hypothetical protein [Hymenobacter sp.]